MHVRGASLFFAKHKIGGAIVRGECVALVAVTLCEFRAGFKGERGKGTKRHKKDSTSSLSSISRLSSKLPLAYIIVTTHCPLFCHLTCSISVLLPTCTTSSYPSLHQHPTARLSSTPTHHTTLLKRPHGNQKVSPGRIALSGPVQDGSRGTCRRCVQVRSSVHNMICLSPVHSQTFTLTISFA
jgi:hypothetical protein